MRRFSGIAQALLALGLSNCGAGVAGVAATSGGSGGGSTPTITLFRVLGPKVSPATLHLEASEGVLADFFFARGGVEEPMSALTGPGVSGNRVQLKAGVNDLTWDFAAELGGTAFVRDVDLIARRTDGTPINGGRLSIGMGNDAPTIEGVFAPTAEVVGTADVRFTVADSSSDLVDVRVEVNTDAPDFPEESWTLAHPAGLPPGTPTPDFAFRGVRARTAAEGGTALVFFWDVVGDLGRTEHDARMRFTAIDLDDAATQVDVGIPVASGDFHVDNNAAPIVQLQNDAVISNPDERRGIPIPFRVIDEEGDLVEVIFQWRRDGEEFPSLDVDGDGEIGNAELDALLADPVLRQERHVCTPYPRFAHGLVVPVDEDTVRLPELARSESWILASGIVGRTLELLRPSSIPAPITPTWDTNPLVSPSAALPVGDGLTALVLDVPGTGRLREIELATGAIVREIASLGPGIPSAICFERGGEKAALVALDDAGTWRIERVELSSGVIMELVVSDGSEPAPVRGIASLGTKALVFTAGSSLFHLDYRDPPAPQLARLLTGLATPWGVVVDPLPAHRIYLSERDANRVLAIEFDSYGQLPLVVKTEDMLPTTLDSPGALALERNGSRMLIVASAPGGRALYGLDIGAQGGNVSFRIGEAAVADVSSLSTGPDALQLISHPGADELLVAGGLEQRRTIAAHSTASQDTAMESSFDPVPIQGQPWRVPEEALVHGSTRGVEGRFAWDSADAGGGRGGFPTTNRPNSVAAADLDGNGDQDLVSANGGGDNLTVFPQLSPGSYATAPLVLGRLGTTGRPSSVAAADLDGDGDLDLVSANRAGHNLTIFPQLSPGSFAPAPPVLGGFPTTNEPRSVAVADLDGDGDQDLVSANRGSNNLTVFPQLSPGSFAAAPLVLGRLGTTGSPSSVAAADLERGRRPGPRLGELGRRQPDGLPAALARELRGRAARARRLPDVEPALLSRGGGPRRGRRPGPRLRERGR